MNYEYKFDCQKHLHHYLFANMLFAFIIIFLSCKTGTMGLGSVSCSFGSGLFLYLFLGQDVHRIKNLYRKSQAR